MHAVDGFRAHLKPKPWLYSYYSMPAVACSHYIAACVLRYLFFEPVASRYIYTLGCFFSMPAPEVSQI